jgi:pimeloyl-ACP methyl ester carboxylesterase
MTKIEKVVQEFQALLDEPLTLDVYAEIDLPCHLIVGVQSTFPAKSVAELLRQHLSRLFYPEVSGGHMSPISHAEEVNEIICAALKNYGMPQCPVVFDVLDWS